MAQTDETERIQRDLRHTPSPIMRSVKPITGKLTDPQARVLAQFDGTELPFVSNAPLYGIEPKPSTRDHKILLGLIMGGKMRVLQVDEPLPGHHRASRIGADAPYHYRLVAADRTTTSGAHEGDARSDGRKYGEETLRSYDFRAWVYDQIYEASQMDPTEVLPLKTKADARVIATNTLQQLEWDIKHQLARPEAFYAGLHEALTDERAVDHLAEEILRMSRDLEGRERQERHSWRPEARESARGHGRKPFAGIDAIDRMIVPIKNGLANIILDGPTDRSDSVLERARGLLADLESQRAPRGHATHWLQGKVDSLRISLATAEAVRSGTRAPGPMTAQDYDRVRWADTFTEESRSGKIRWGELLAYVPIPDSNGGYRSSDGKWLIGRFHDRYVLKNIASGEMTTHKRLSDAKATAAGETPPQRHSGRRATTPRPQWWGIWDETSQEWMTNPLTGNFGAPMRFSDRRSAEHSADRNWRPRNPDRTFTVKPMSEERKMHAYSRELIAEYHTRTGQVGAKVYREHTSRGVTYAYTGKWGGGSGLQKADMKARIDGWLTQKRGVKTITPFSD